MDKRVMMVCASLLSVAPLALASGFVATTVHDSQQGLQYNHRPVATDRRDPASVLDQAPDNHFFSLGFYPAGHVTLELAEELQSGQITVWETTWLNGNYCLETASVEVADKDLANWTLLGVADNDRGAGGDFHSSSFSFDAGQLGFCAKYVRITETSSLAEIAARCNTGDGFDLDAVEVTGAPCEERDEVGAEELPGAVRLAGNWPNPFNPMTSIHFSVAETGTATLEVFNLAGTKVATLVDGMVEAGAHQVSFDAGQLPSGVYLSRLQAGGVVQTRKMTLIK